MVTEGDKVVTPAQLGLIGAAPPAGSPARHQQLFLHSIQEDGSSQVPLCLSFSSLTSQDKQKPGVKHEFIGICRSYLTDYICMTFMLCM